MVAAVIWLFSANVQHYYFLSDDAFISFRYANHLVQGQGLVWNPGERVEGYTNFLWVLLMAASLALGVEPEIASNALGIASGVALLAALLLFSAQTRGWRDPFIWVAPLVLATSRSFTAWCTGGLETMFFSLLVFLGNLAFLRERERNSAWPFGSSILFSVAALTRPEGAIFAFAVGLLFAIEIGLRRRYLRAGAIWVLPFVVIVGSHLLWRHAYYGFWLPNTFYAKVPGAWWDQGARYLALFHEDYRIACFLPLLLPALLRGRRFASTAFSTTTGVYLIYVCYVGGDRFEFRFLVPVLPYFYWLLGESLYRLARLAGDAWPGRAGAYALTAAAVAGLLIATHVGSRRPESVYLRHGVTSVQAVEHYATWRAGEGKILRSMIDEGLLPPDLVLAVTGAGAVPYYTDWPTIDSHGLNDAEIARLPLLERSVIAHERTAPYDYLVARKVAIFDILNRIVHLSDLARQQRPVVEYDGRRVPLKVVRVKGHYLIFATTLADHQLDRSLPGLEILH
jgi:hypothetical protein